MRGLHDRVARDEAEETWLFVEHDPVITLGRSARRDHVHLSDEALAARGVDLVSVERGGDATYHGPGQLVVYPIRKLRRFREVAPLVSALERIVVATLVRFGIAAKPRPEHRGVYVGAAAICAIGLAVKQMTSLHGLALNVSTTLDYDRLIVPCGTPEFGITSMERELERAVSIDEARSTIVREIEREFAIAFDTESDDSVRGRLAAATPAMSNGRLS